MFPCVGYSRGLEYFFETVLFDSALDLMEIFEVILVLNYNLHNVFFIDFIAD